MASHGARASGGDGGDFTHRERVATQYKESAAYKQRFGTVSLAHSVIVMAATGNIAYTYLSEKARADDVPPGTIMQIVFSLSLVAVLLARTASSRNLATRMYVSVVIFAFTTLVPLLAYGGLLYGRPEDVPNVETDMQKQVHYGVVGLAIVLDLYLIVIMRKLAQCWEIVGADGKKRR